MSGLKPQCGFLLLLDNLPADDNISFLETSFFTKHREQLPTPAEVREAAGPESKIWRPPPVSFPSMNLIVKYGRSITKSEGQCLWAVRRLCPNVPVPEVYGWCQDGGETFIYMQLIGGATLEHEWPGMDLEERYEICTQLCRMLNELRQLRQDPSDQFIGTINRQPVQDIILQDDHFETFSDVTSFYDWFSGVIMSHMDLSDPDPWRPGLLDDVPIVFTHADLHRSNIMMTWDGNSKPRVAAIVDWHQSGWYPACWEFYKTRYTAREGSGLTEQNQLDCLTFVEKLYPTKSVSPAPCQGYCSMTLLVGEDVVIQFRPVKYRLDLRTTSAARDVYGSFSPETKYIARLPASDLLVYSMDRIRGISFRDLRASTGASRIPIHLRARLCRDFAVFLSKSWNQGTEKPKALGTVGRSLKTRLQSLCKDLPLRFRARARHILTNMNRIEAIPWVLTHGDIVAANIMVEPSTGALTGLVDWAEAEVLPFGTCLYGLEELLGEMTSGGFQYIPEAGRLKKIFWVEMKRNIPALKQPHVLEAVNLGRDLGVLLWHGIAFDDGAINRVVQEGRDIEGIHRLDSLFPVQSLDHRCHLPKL